MHSQKNISTIGTDDSEQIPPEIATDSTTIEFSKWLGKMGVKMQYDPEKNMDFFSLFDVIPTEQLQQEELEPDTPTEISLDTLNNKHQELDLDYYLHDNRFGSLDNRNYIGPLRIIPSDSPLNVPVKIKNDNLSTVNQSGCSTNQIFNTLRNSHKSSDLPPKMNDGVSSRGKDIIDRPMQRIQHDIPPGYKRMTMWDHELQRFGIATVSEDTPELTYEEIVRYSSIKPK